MVVRDLLRRMVSWRWSIPGIAYLLKSDESRARRLVRSLVADGYLQAERIPGQGSGYTTTRLGQRLNNAKATRPISRERARQIVQEFLERVRLVNESSDYVYRVVRVSAFGSFIEDREDLGDIDLVLELSTKFPDRREREAAENARIREAEAGGRVFRTILDGLDWPQQEVRLFLRNRSPYLSFHGKDEAKRLKYRTVVLFESK